MDQPIVKFTVYQSGTVVQTQECGPDMDRPYEVPSMPSAEERAAILGSSNSNELIEQQKYIEKLLDSLSNAGYEANSALTQLMDKHASTTASAADNEDYSSGEDAGDPNESTSLKPPFKAQLRRHISHRFSVLFSAFVLQSCI